MSEVDISALRMTETPPPRRPLGPRIALGVLVLLALGVAATFLVPLLTPPRPVATAPVQTATAEAGSGVATAEAAGWIEPDPYAVTVRPLVGGVLEELSVLEGDRVEKGVTVIGRLRSAALEAARDRAQARLVLEDENVKHRGAELEVAEGLLEQRAELRLDEVRARHGLAAVRARLATAQAERDARKADHEGQRKLMEAGGTYPVALKKAAAELRAAEARVEELAARHAEHEATLAIAKEVLKDPRGLEGVVVTARANVAHRRAMRNAARVELEIAERELTWATLKAPADGVVLKLLAAPGDVVGPDAKALVSTYDPARLQARIDVSLDSIEGVHVGQEVEISSEVLGSKKTRGVVLRIQRESDLLKNTLQVKVRIDDPDPLLRPETLCRARFQASGKTAARGPALFRVPKAAVRDGAVFLLDPTAGRARRVPVERVGEVGDLVVVRGALSVTHKVILDEVEDGERVEGRP